MRDPLYGLTVVIPSSGRPGRQTTLAQLPDEVRRRTHLAVPARELAAYQGWAKQVRLVGIPNEVQGISGTRKYLMSKCPTRYLLMLDDDMTFAYRPDITSPKLVSLAPGDELLRQLFHYWQQCLQQYAHVGLSARQGNNRVTQDLRPCCRMYNAYTYDLERVRQAGPVIGRLPVMEDFDLTLQLLRLGLPNAVIYRWCWNQGGSNLPGGCSRYRTAAMQAQAAQQLAQLHPGLVRVVVKQSKNWQGMAERVDVVVAWQKALARSTRSSDGDGMPTDPAPS